MKLSVDVPSRTVSFLAPKACYSMDGLRIAAHVFSGRAEVSASDAKGAYEIELTARRKDFGAAELEALAGEFMNELLNQEYRFLVGRFNQKLSGLIVTQTLFAARGGENPPPRISEAEKTPEFQAQVEALMKATREEIERTMPKRIPPQGTPIPPEREERVV